MDTIGWSYTRCFLIELDLRERWARLVHVCAFFGVEVACLTTSDWIRLTRFPVPFPTLCYATPRLHLPHIIPNSMQPLRGLSHSRIVTTYMHLEENTTSDSVPSLHSTGSGVPVTVARSTAPVKPYRQALWQEDSNLSHFSWSLLPRMTASHWHGSCSVTSTHALR